MNESTNLPPLPMKPFSNNHYPITNDSSTQNNNQGFPETQNPRYYDDIAEMRRYLREFHESVIPRIQYYEGKQKELDALLSKETILKESINKLYFLTIFFGVILVIIGTITSYIIIREIYFNDFKSFFELVPIGVIVGALAYINPIWNLRRIAKNSENLENRIKSIENTLANNR